MVISGFVEKCVAVEREIHAQTKDKVTHDPIQNSLPLQVAGMSWGIIPYCRRRLSRNYLLGNSVLLRQWGPAVSHNPLPVDLWMWFLSSLFNYPFCLPISAISNLSLHSLSPALALHTHALWSIYLRLVPPRRDSTSSPHFALEVFYAHSADIQGYDIWYT